MPLAEKNNRIYTYKDYIEWPDDIRCELINGVIYDMTPAPSHNHQKLSTELLGRFWEHLKDKPCEVLAAPYDVRLPEGNEPEDNIKTVVQPDISVICDKKKIDQKGCIGAPDLIIEITSPSTASLDLKEKFNLYEKHGVKEYWLVHPEEKIVMVFTLGRDKKYGRPKNFSKEDTIKVGVIKGLFIELKDVFKD